jgi:ubiquinone/menaquinone biosynthesis C-methylase UbiE
VSLYWLLLGLPAITAVALLIYWLVIITEGVYLGPRIVVWLYDLTAGRYDNIKQFDPDAERYFVIYPLLHNLAAFPAPLVLDVATGTGRLPLYLLDESTFNGRVIGLDASARMLAQAAPKVAPFRRRAALVQQTAVALPFPDEAFHAVTCLEALEFFPDELGALQEMARVLCPGGTLMITRRRGWEAQTFLGRYLSPQQFAERLEALGFVNVEISLWQVEYDLVTAHKSAYS